MLVCIRNSFPTLVFWDTHCFSTFWRMQSSKTIDFVRAVYPYACTDQAKGLAFPESVVLLVVERSEDGWCRGFAAGNQGWFPASYVQSLPLEKLQEVCGGAETLTLCVCVCVCWKSLIIMLHYSVTNYITCWSWTISACLTS